jgi:hypothetical protein
VSEQPDECECCGFETKKLTLFKNQDTAIAAGLGKLRKDDFWFCELCAGSFASVSYRFLYEDSGVMKTICYVGNVLLQEIRKRK